MRSLITSVLDRFLYERRLSKARSSWAVKYEVAVRNGDEHAAKMASLWIDYLDDVMSVNM